MEEKNKISQTKRMIREMRKRKVMNYEFVREMFILSYTKRISEIRQLGITVNKERVYDNEGKATGVFYYWIPRSKKSISNWDKFEPVGKEIN